MNYVYLVTVYTIVDTEYVFEYDDWFPRYNTKILECFKYRKEAELFCLKYLEEYGEECEILSLELKDKFYKLGNYEED